MPGENDRDQAISALFGIFNRFIATKCSYLMGTNTTCCAFIVKKLTDYGNYCYYLNPLRSPNEKSPQGRESIAGFVPNVSHGGLECSSVTKAWREVAVITLFLLSLTQYQLKEN